MFDPSDKSGEISDGEFLQRIASVETRLDTQNAIRTLIRKPSFELPDIKARLTSQSPEDRGKQGSCYVLRPRGGSESLLVTSARFPNYLMTQQGVDRERALRTAAVFARGLDFMNAALTGKKTWHGAENRAVQRVKRNPDAAPIWDPRLDDMVLKVEFKAAGSIAVEATGIIFQVVTEQLMPPHIAGLVDPLPAPSKKGTTAQNTFLELQEIVSHTS
jgi:hypothetical protein